MNYINAICRTNLDGYEFVNWPKRFVALPRVGDWVEGDGPPPVTRPQLQIVSIVHYENKDGPAIYVELHRASVTW